MRVALVLSGGGAKAAFEAGVVAALEDEGITPDICSGTSAGALNAAAVASGLGADAIVELWSSMESADVFRVRRDLHRLTRPLHLLGHPRRLLGLGNRTTSEHLLDAIGWTWLFHLGPLRDRMVELLGGERVPVVDGRVLTVAATRAGTGEIVRFTSTAPPPAHDDESHRVVDMTVDHVLASAAIPGLFRPIEVEGATWWDGGLVANTPLSAALDHEPDVAFVVASGAVDREQGPPESLGQLISLAVDHLLRAAIVKDLDHAGTVNQLVAADPGATKHRAVELVPIVPTDARLGLGQLLDFEPARAKEQIAGGRGAARAAIAAWRDGRTADLDR